MNLEYEELIESIRVSSQTRVVLKKREEPDDLAYQPQVLSRNHFKTLQRMLTRVIPQDGPDAIDLAGRLDRQVLTGKGDGWRYVKLPADAEALPLGLEALNQLAQNLCGASYNDLSDAAADDLLDAIVAGRVSSDRIDLQLWFEDLRANAVRIYVSHPKTLAAIGYSGIADDPQGFVEIGIGQTESWEPRGPVELER